MKWLFNRFLTAVFTSWAICCSQRISIMSDWSSTFWASTAGLFGDEDDGDTVDPDQQVSKHEMVNQSRFYFKYCFTRIPSKPDACPGIPLDPRGHKQWERGHGAGSEGKGAVGGWKSFIEGILATN